MSDDDIRSYSLTIAARARCDARTVVKVFRGGKVLPVVRVAIESAARELGITLPAVTTPEGKRAA